MKTNMKNFNKTQSKDFVLVNFNFFSIGKLDRIIEIFIQ